jgi:hypothetical protein
MSSNFLRRSFQLVFSETVARSFQMVFSPDMARSSTLVFILAYYGSLFVRGFLPTFGSLI